MKTAMVETVKVEIVTRGNCCDFDCDYLEECDDGHLGGNSQNWRCNLFITALSENPKAKKWCVERCYKCKSQTKKG